MEKTILIVWLLIFYAEAFINGREKKEKETVNTDNG